MGRDVIQPDNDPTAEINPFGRDEKVIENGRHQKQNQ
jgi:hypothetical protein